MKNDYPKSSGQPRSIRDIADLARDLQHDINAVTNAVTPGTDSGGSDGVSQEKALRDMERAVEGLDTIRRLLALLYAGAPSGTITEHAVGESLTKVRVALARMRKAVGELAQEELGFGVSDSGRDGDHSRHGREDSDD